MEEKILKDIVLEDMTFADVPDVAEIERISFSTPWSEISFFNELKRPEAISRVARMDGKTVGYLCARRVLDEGHILTLAVHPDFRGRGTATLLIDEMIGRLKREGCRSVFLELRISNEDAKRIYEKFHFKVLGIRKNYYTWPAEDALVMVLRMGE